MAFSLLSLQLDRCAPKMPWEMFAVTAVGGAAIPNAFRAMADIPSPTAKELAFTMMLAEGGDPLAQGIMSRKPAAIQRLAFKMREESEKRLMKLEEQEQRAYLHAELGIKPQES